MVKFVRSASVAWGLQVQILGEDLAPLVKPCCGSIPHKTEGDWHRYYLRANLTHTHTHTQIIIVIIIRRIILHKHEKQGLFQRMWQSLLWWF